MEAFEDSMWSPAIPWPPIMICSNWSVEGIRIKQVKQSMVIATKCWRSSNLCCSSAKNGIFMDFPCLFWDPETHQEPDGKHDPVQLSYLKTKANFEFMTTINYPCSCSWDFRMLISTWSHLIRLMPFIWELPPGQLPQGGVALCAERPWS